MEVGTNPKIRSSEMTKPCLNFDIKTLEAKFSFWSFLSFLFFVRLA